jgi:D-inositol-3-phosphate glycosyltransferase
MISFIWPPGEAMLAGTGGSETFTAGQVRELRRRGINAQVIHIGEDARQSTEDFPDIPFISFAHADSISSLSGRVVFVNRAYDVPTRNKSAIILHCAVPSDVEKAERMNDVLGRTIIATSVYNAQMWALYLGLHSSKINVVMPFADPIFGNVVRPKPTQEDSGSLRGSIAPGKGYLYDS